MVMILGTVGLQTSIWNNNLRSLLLLALYPFILASMAWVIAALWGAMMLNGHGLHGPVAWNRAAAFGTGLILQYWPAILTVVAVWFVVSYFSHAAMIRTLARATPVERSEEPELYNLLENLCISRGLKMPALAVVETDALNAFASGIDEGSYSVTVTRGLLQALPRDEMEAVLAHELSHIINRDVRLMVVSVIFVGMLGFFAQLLWSQLRWNLYFRPRRDRDDGGQIFLFLIAVEVILWIGYMTTLVARFALSRKRECMADEGSVELTKNPEALMRALLRIAGHDRIPHASQDIAQMCIENSRPFLGLFATHPPIDERVRHISALTGVPVPDGQSPDKNSPDGRGAGRPNPWA